MQGLMMDRALVIPAIIDHAAQYHGDTEVVSVNTLGGQHRTNYAQIRARALRMASALEKRGMRKSDRIATIAWNNYRHLELYYAISGSGYVLHTINPRLFAEQLIYIINHAEDRILFFDATFLPLVEPLRAHLPQVELFVLMEAPDAATAQKFPWLTFYEDLLAEGENGHHWPPTLDERDASSLCYTSGTTGNPKGVLYSHRSTLLHAMMSTTPDVMNFSARDCLLPVVPMFHVNAWGTAYAAPMVGAKLVLPGPGLDGKSLVTLFNTERVTISAGVPTIWGGLIAYLGPVRRNRAAPFAHHCRRLGLPALHHREVPREIRRRGHPRLGHDRAFPLGSVNNLKNKHRDLPVEEQNKLRFNQGRPPFGIELGIFDDNDKRLPEDGVAQGNLYCRGFWVLSEYFKGEGGNPQRADGWFPTGDVATIDPDGNMTIRDRSKDIIKSGGEWISTVELEGLALAHPAVKDAAVIAARHEKWDERPLLIIVPQEGKTFTNEDMRAFYEGKVAKWWVPDAVQIVSEIPRNATGKIRKNVLRDMYGGVLLG